MGPNINSASMDARKEIGLGQPPASYGSNCDQMLADQCAVDSPPEVAEVVQWRVDLPVADATVPTTFGDRINIWGTPDGNPPDGVTAATNTLATPGLFACNMVLRGIRVRVGVEPENRTILGNFVDFKGLNSLPGSPDTWSLNDLANALGIAGAGPGIQTIVPAELLYGKPTWKAAYACFLGYELAVLKDHQDALVRQPLTQVGTIQPFAEAEAAGLAFASNQDTVLAINERLRLLLGVTQQFVPEYFKRLGSATSGAGANFGVFTPSREADASSTMFGGIGVPQARYGMREPLLFSTPMFWPAGHPIAIQLMANNVPYQNDFQRWISLTGGQDGTPGDDLSMPFTKSVANHIMPTSAAVDTMAELTLDPLAPIFVDQQVETLRVILKAGVMLFEIAVIGWRVPPDWDPVVARAIRRGVLTAPRGYGSLSAFINAP